MEYKHFSHQHTLTLYKVEPNQQQFNCHGCNQPCKDSIFACWNCSFFLHEHCGNANRYVKHPSHPSHALILMPNPTYCSSTFLCNACGAPGTAFSYSCALCEVDLHVPCTYLPPKVGHHSHQHDLYLAMKPMVKKDSPFYCKICTRELETTKYWYYFCDKPECDFRVHTFCATSEVQLGLYQDDEPDGQNTGGLPPQAAAATAEEALAEMFQIQMQLEMANQLNQIMNSGRTY